MDMAILAILDSIANDNCESANLGAIQAQALRCYNYIVKFIKNNPDFASRLQGDPTMSKTNWNNNSMIEVLVATITGVNSPHPQKLKMDEVELIPWPILQEAFSMVQSKEGVTGCTVLGSTRKFAAGPMQRLVDDAKKKDKTTKVYQWCIWEVVEALPKDNPELLQRIHDTFGDRLPINMEFFSGYYKWEDLIDKYNQLDRDIWETQWECKRADVQGMVYPRYDEVLNAAPEEWELDLVAVRSGWKTIYVFEDFGYDKEHPNVILFVQIDYKTQEIIIFDELYTEFQVTDEILRQFMQKLDTYDMSMNDITGWVADPHAVEEQMHRYNKGFPMLGNRFLPEGDPRRLKGEMYVIVKGIPVVRRYIDDRKLRLTKNIIRLREELMSYSRKKGLDGKYLDEPVKDFDHGPDALRYGLIWLFPQQAIGAFGENDYKQDFLQETQTKPYTAGLYHKTF